MSIAASQIYARQLLSRKLGYPLFVPEPNERLPDAYRQKGVSIGDVGIIAQNGSFTFAFNACAAADDPINCHGVPVGFKAIAIDPLRISSWRNMHKKGSEVVSSSIKKESIDVSGGLKENDIFQVPVVSVCYRLESSCSEAAVLTMPDGASCEDYQSLAELRTHAIRNAVSWYEFINGRLGFEARNGSVYFVSGCDKATTWGVAAVSNASASTSLALRFTTAQVVEAKAAYKYSWEAECPASWRTGPDASEDVQLPQNQCLFLRGFKVMLRERPMATLKGPARAVSISDMKTKDVVYGGKTDFFPGSKSRGANNPTPSTSSPGSPNLGMGDSSMSSPPSDDSCFSGDSDGDLDPDAGVYHPLDIINRSILDMGPQTQADVVITHESDWWSLSKNDTLESGEDMLERLWSVYEGRTELGNDGLKCVYLSGKQDPASNIGTSYENENRSWPQVGLAARFGASPLLRAGEPTAVVWSKPASPRRRVDDLRPGEGACNKPPEIARMFKSL